MSDFLPPELLVDILKRLGVEDLGRCLMVCKSWYSLITSPSFISLHSQIQSSPTNNNKSGLLLVRSCDVRPYKERYSIRFDSDIFEEYKNLNFPFKSRINYFRIIGCFNGVVCLCDGYDNQSSYNGNTIILWNPSIKASVTLPEPVLCRFLSHTIGFAFCAATNDFKVVRVLYGGSPPELEVCDLSKGCWRRVDSKGFPYIVHSKCRQAYLNGAVHWTGHSQTHRTDGFFNVIVSFDMGTEELGVIEIPPHVADNDYWPPEPDFRVSVLWESLSIIYHVSSQDFGNLCDIWVMKEYAKPESWTKMFTIDLDGGLAGAFGFLRNGQVLVAESTNPWNASELRTRYKLASYDPQSKQLKHIGISGDLCGFCVDYFVETLALLGVRSQRRQESGGTGKKSKTYMEVNS